MKGAIAAEASELLKMAHLRAMEASDERKNTNQSL